ncbi:MAG: ABC transporter substrate-binding protein, partial [Anaerolineae bacterium]|nr:ABC transporter substrate-binding protein [Anaerolineae bacterium]
MRKLNILALIVVLALVISGAYTALARQSVEITLMGWSSSTEENDALMNQVKAFETANPDIKVNVNLVPSYNETIQAAFASGDSPNVFYIDSSKLPDWVEADVVASGEGKIENLDDHYESLLEAFTYDGTLYCPPKDFSLMVLQYNKDMFDAAGIDYPTADWTWDDLRSAAEKLTGETEDGKKVLGLVTPPNFERWLPFLYQAGGSFLNEDWTEVTLDSDEAREALDFYVGMAIDGIAGPPSMVDAGWGGEAFGQGRVAMAMEGNWVISYLREQFPDLNWGVTELPMHPNGGKATMVFTVCYGVASENDYPDESWKLANFLTGPEGSKLVAEVGFGVIPPAKSAADTWLAAIGPEIGEGFLAGADYAYKWQVPV